MIVLAKREAWPWMAASESIEQTPISQARSGRMQLRIHMGASPSSRAPCSCTRSIVRASFCVLQRAATGGERLPADCALWM